MSQHFRTFDGRGQSEGEEAFDAQVDTESFYIFNEKLFADAYIDEDFCKIPESKDSSEAGWCHAVLRLARHYSEPHPALRIVDESASPDGKLMQLTVSSLMRTCQTGKDFSCGGKSWFVLVNKEVVICTYEGWGDNLGCVVAGAVARADGHDVHPGLSNATGDDRDDDPTPADIQGTIHAGIGSEPFNENVDDDELHNGVASHNENVIHYDSARKIAAMMLSARGGLGLFLTDMDALLAIVRNPHFDPCSIPFRTGKECLQWTGRQTEVNAWQEVDMRKEDMWFRDWKTAFLSLLEYGFRSKNKLVIEVPAETD
ncbi:hypothetical protein CBR_g37867 [Chara braunii]|uniref:Uncharacterized protein n=1 Tax=Chara braunii TaxID=69332 RepID=A0A388LNW7_CHABU|nr:hypothetical protein CBR_g37867 [Chara braunii]|eukprot:GBG83994.1 hypothetical protein CBR_g37867 [Chara braunii]